ncbi:MAG: hypothetical protein R2764_24950 [Bacteroidales bacterium]
MRLQNLQAQEQEKLKENIAELMKLIERLKEILSDENYECMIKEELTEIRISMEMIPGQKLNIPRKISI